MSVSIAILGAGGRMGRMLISAITESEQAHLCGAGSHAKSPLVGEDSGRLAGLEDNGIPVTADVSALFHRLSEQNGVAIDFSTPAATVEHARIAVASKVALVVGVTGLTRDQTAQLEDSARHIPIVKAANFSAGITLLRALTKQAASILGPDYDIEVVEMHHRHKADAPSGTALALGEAAAQGRGIMHDRAAILSREGQTGPRPVGSIGYATLRGGDIIGDHHVMLAGSGERITLSHTATTRHVFASGAVRAAIWAARQKPGLYDMEDVLGLSGL